MSSIKIADQYIEYRFLYPETASYFTPYLAEVPEGVRPLQVQTSAEIIDRYASFRGTPVVNRAGAEHDVLTIPTSVALMDCGTWLFHSVGFSCNGKGVLFTGPSGIGKTTHYAQWKRLLRERVSIISGDMPAISVRDDGEIRVSPTPWNGKENLHGFADAPLAAIVVLERGDRNIMEPMAVRDAVFPVLRQMCIDRRDTDCIRKALELEDRLLRKIPVWRLWSRGDLDAARVSYRELTGVLYE